MSSLIGGYQHFGAICRLWLPLWRWRLRGLCVTGNAYQTTQLHNPEDHSLNVQCC